MKSNVWGVVIAWLTVSLLSGCAGLALNEKHPLLKKGEEADIARVYIIRPVMRRHSGAMDRPIDIILDGERLLTLNKGFYTLVSLVPQQVDMIVRSYMHSGVDEHVSEVAEKRQFNFQSGQTYFIYLKPYYRGYNWGTSFVPENVDQAKAIDYVQRLKPLGEAQRQPLK